MKKLMTMSMAYALLISCTQTSWAVFNDTTIPWDFIPARTSTPKPTNHVQMVNSNMPASPFSLDDAFVVIDEFGDNEPLQAPLMPPLSSPSTGSQQTALSSPSTTSIGSSDDTDSDDQSFTAFLNAHAHLPASTPDTSFEDEAAEETLPKPMGTTYTQQEFDEDMAHARRLKAQREKAASKKPFAYSTDAAAFTPSGAAMPFQNEQLQQHTYVPLYPLPMYPAPILPPFGHVPYLASMLMMNGGGASLLPGGFAPLAFNFMPSFRPHHDPYAQSEQEHEHEEEEKKRKAKKR